MDSSIYLETIKDGINFMRSESKKAIDKPFTVSEKIPMPLEFGRVILLGGKFNLHVVEIDETLIKVTFINIPIENKQKVTYILENYRMMIIAYDGQPEFYDQVFGFELTTHNKEGSARMINTFYKNLINYLLRGLPEVNMKMQLEKYYKH